ncbi:MAG TPA: guanylate kinase, partial [Blastocatellia bacterium]|nr:guanylate kinase [Blastocatellia bacterium]
MSNSPTNSGSGNLAGAAGPVGEETGYAPAQGPRGELIVVSAPSGAGKSSIIERVVSRSGRLVYSISYTTRPARGPEKDGVDYHFVSQEDFTAMRERGEFLEWARVHGHLYGTRLATVEMALAAGNDVILDIDVQGANQVRRRLERAVTVFVFPPSRAALVDRLSARNLNTPGDLAYRLENASSE